MSNMDVLKNNSLNLDLDNHMETLGEFLRFHREQKLISLEELSMKTKIRIQQLTLLEQNNFMELPNAVYLKGFIKSICYELDLNVEIALNYLKENTIAENAIEEALDFLTPGKEIKRLPFDFKFFNRSKIKMNQKLLIVSIVAITIGGSFIGNFRIKPEVAGPAIVHKQMSFLQVKKLIQPDGVTDLAPPEGLGYIAQGIVPNEVPPPNKILMNNDLLNGKKMITELVAAQVSTPLAELESSAQENLTKLSVTAKKGTVFLAYRVNGEKKNKIYLQRGKTLELLGKEIRMDVGNPGAVEFSKNGEPMEVKAEPGQATLHIKL